MSPTPAPAALVGDATAPRLAIVIVSYNTRRMIRRCLQSPR